MQFLGKTVEEAVKNGLTAMGLDESDAEITVISDAVKGLFGRVKKEAVVEITAKTEVITTKKAEVKEEEIKEKLETVKGKAEKSEKSKANAIDFDDTAKFVQRLLDEIKVDAKAEVNGEVINIIAKKSSDVIGFRGECLDAIQTLAGAKANIGKKDYTKVVVDCENYRAKREETLISLAHKLENKATEMRREVMLEPMSPYERRIIHTALSESTTVTTKSDGAEPNRYVVIVPNDKDEFSHPYNAGRNEKRNGGNFDKRKKGGKDFKKGNRKSGFSEETKRVKPSGFGTYLGNSLKDNK